MIKFIIKIVVGFVFFVLLQVWVLNDIHLFKIVEPFLYIYVIVKFPVRMTRVQILLVSFLLGLVIDMFSNTLGMHAAACSLIGFLRNPLMGAYVDKDVMEGATPSYRTFGTGAFMRYTVTLVIIHHVVLFLIESISLFDPVFLLLRIFASIILTTLCIFVVEAFNVNRKSGSA
ncbi:MAG: rod shape-determining protein MreD [Tannerella sp.]|jgi:rod shape-determining protein MreD|nr:rod shape-determining protein MreD [Tannerella sp.]